MGKSTDFREKRISIEILPQTGILVQWSHDVILSNVQIHFHWDMGHNGSEHSIDAKQSTAEVIEE